MIYESMMFCEHANECPTSICRCPPNCGCRERMCKLVVDDFIQGSCTVVDAAGSVHVGGHVRATFDACRFWNARYNPVRLEAWGCDRLELTESTVRDIVAGQLPIQVFNGAHLEIPALAAVPFQLLHMVWGNFVLYETGEPVIRNFVAVPEQFSGLPPPALVRRVLALLKSTPKHL